jgi:threonine synthase
MATRLVCADGHVVPVFAGHAACPRCGALLDPVVDVAALRRTSARTWARRMDARAASAAPVDRSGVWCFREWVLPELPHKHVVTLGEGRAPLVPVQIEQAAVLVKQCGQAPTGSFKDLGMTVLVSAAKRMGARSLLCASTGDTSAALAAYGARAGIPVVVLLPKGKVSPAQLLQPLAHGARVVELDGDFDACMRVVQDLAARPGVLLANSKNPLRLLGQQTVAFEIARDLATAADVKKGVWRAPDVVVVPSGNLGNVFALHLGFSLLRALGLTRSTPRLVAAQVSAADPLHRTRLGDAQLARLERMQAGETLATAIRIGDPVSFPRARRALLESKGTTTSCSEDEIVEAMGTLDRQGLLCDPQTGAAVAAVPHLVREGFVKRGARVVVVSTASGLKFTEAKASVERARPLHAPARADAVVDVLQGAL